ncbi:MAG: PRC-barrel domain containing protein [Actinomycetota bacterium]|nr:PRC-barrel domain containing protein [Actinomycetota bacterium]
MQTDVWTLREGVPTLTDEMVGFEVEGRDGTIGKVDHVSFAGTCVIISTSRFFGRKHVVPAGSVERIDPDDKKIFVDLATEDVENSPDYDDKLGFDDDCEASVGDYYETVRGKQTAVT